MELIVQALMLVICLVACVKLSHAPSWAGWVYALVTAGFIWLTADISSSQTRSGIGAYIEHRELREYIAILVTLESMLIVAFTFLSLGREGWCKARRFSPKHLLGQALVFYPSLLVFPVLLYAQTNLFFALPGVAFETISLSFALGMFLFFAFTPRFVRFLLPEREMRLEILFLCSLIVFILGLITTVDDRLIYHAPEYPFPWRGLVLVLGVFALCFTIGFFFPRIKRLITKR